MSRFAFLLLLMIAVLAIGQGCAWVGGQERNLTPALPAQEFTGEVIFASAPPIESTFPCILQDYPSAPAPISREAFEQMASAVAWQREQAWEAWAGVMSWFADNCI